MRKFISKLRIKILYRYYKKVFSEQKVRHLLNNHEFQYLATQGKVSLPRIERIYIKMKMGITFPGIMCKDELLVEGHHRHICSILAKTNLDVIKYNSMRNCPTYEWKDLKIEAADYDKESELKKYNLQNSRKDNIDRELFNKLFRVVK